jgi:hypothetical protein
MWSEKQINMRISAFERVIRVSRSLIFVLESASELIRERVSITSTFQKHLQSCLLRRFRSRAASSAGEGCIGVGGPPRKLLPNSLRSSTSALRIEGRSSVNSATTTRNFKNNAMELICSMRSTLSLFNLKQATLWETLRPALNRVRSTRGSNASTV